MYTLKDILGWIWALFVLVVIVLLVGFTLHEVIIDQHPVTGQVTDVVETYYHVDGTFANYLAQIDNDRYYSIGGSAGKNLMIDQCYLLRKGAFSKAYNLFEPVPCKDVD